MEFQSSWESLCPELQGSVILVLWLEQDRDSIQSMLQASREMRDFCSSLISALTISDKEKDRRALRRFPSHATITALRFDMAAGKDGEGRLLEPSDVAAWLERASDKTSRLSETVEKVELFLPAKGDVSISLPKLWPAMSAACPQLSCLCIHAKPNDRGGTQPLDAACLAALRQHMPSLVVLVLDCRFVDVTWVSLDWAASLPPGLRKLYLPQHQELHHELLQHLAQMPCLIELYAAGLGSFNGRSETGDGIPGHRAIQSDACAWQVLRLWHVPDFRDICRFTVWPRVRLEYNGKAHDREVGSSNSCRCACDKYAWSYDWQLTKPGTQNRRAMADAALRLTTCSGGKLDWGGAFCIGWDEEAAGADVAETAAGMLSALAPLAAKLPALCLTRWPVTEALLEEVSQALPHTRRIIFQGCTISSEAWLRMLTMESVTELCFCRPCGNYYRDDGGLQLPELAAFAASVPRVLTLETSGCLFDRRDGGNEEWAAFKANLARRRLLLNLPVVTLKGLPPH